MSSSSTQAAGAETVIIAGTLGSSDVITELVAAGKIDVSAISGKWEAFVSQVVESPLPGVEKAMVIVGRSVLPFPFQIHQFRHFDDPSGTILKR